MNGAGQTAGRDVQQGGHQRVCDKGAVLAAGKPNDPGMVLRRGQVFVTYLGDHCLQYR